MPLCAPKLPLYNLIFLERISFMNNIINKKRIILLATLILMSCSTTPKNDSNDKNKPKVPTIKNAEVKTIWIPDKIEGNKFEEGHYVHIIDKQATWGKE